MMTALNDVAPSTARRWGYTLSVLALSASTIATVMTVTATPAQAVGSFCDTAKAIYTGGYGNTYVIMPASSGADSVNCSMSRGATGGGVNALQQSLNRCYGEQLSVDGQFGPRTQAALTRAQQRHGFASGLGRYTDRDAWGLYFKGVRGLRIVCARLDGPVLQ